MHPDWQFPRLFVVHMPSCLHVLLSVTCPLCSQGGGGGRHFGYVPPGVWGYCHTQAVANQGGGDEAPTHAHTVHARLHCKELQHRPMSGISLHLLSIPLQSQQHTTRQTAGPHGRRAHKPTLRPPQSITVTQTTPIAKRPFPEWVQPKSHLMLPPPPHNLHPPGGRLSLHWFIRQYLLRWFVFPICHRHTFLHCFPITSNQSPLCIL